MESVGRRFVIVKNGLPENQLSHDSTNLCTCDRLPRRRRRVGEDTQCTACGKQFAKRSSPFSFDVALDLVELSMPYRYNMAPHGVVPADEVFRCTTEHCCRNDLSHPSSLETVHSLEDIAALLNQYLSGRQEYPMTILVPVNGEWDAATYDAIKRLFSDFWHSPRRRAFHDNLRIHLLVPKIDGESELHLRHCEKIFP